MVRPAGFLLSLVLGCCSVVAPLATEAQQAGKLKRLVWVSVPADAGFQDRFACFKAGLEPL